MKTFIFILGYTGSNFLFQLFTAVPDWNRATERSFFEIMAIVFYALYMKVNSNDS